MTGGEKQSGGERRSRKEPVSAFVSPSNQFSSGTHQQQHQWRKVESKRRCCDVGNISHHRYEPQTSKGLNYSAYSRFEMLT